MPIRCPPEDLVPHCARARKGDDSSKHLFSPSSPSQYTWLQEGVIRPPGHAHISLAFSKLVLLPLPSFLLPAFLLSPFPRLIGTNSHYADVNANRRPEPLWCRQTPLNDCKSQLQETKHVSCRSEQTEGNNEADAASSSNTDSGMKTLYFIH